MDLSKVVSKVAQEALEIPEGDTSPVGEIPTTGKVLEKYGQVEILSVAGEVLPPLQDKNARADEGFLKQALVQKTKKIVEVP